MPEIWAVAAGEATSEDKSSLLPFPRNSFCQHCQKKLPIEDFKTRYPQKLQRKKTIYIGKLNVDNWSRFCGLCFKKRRSVYDQCKLELSPDKWRDLWAALTMIPNWRRALSVCWLKGIGGAFVVVGRPPPGAEFPPVGTWLVGRFLPISSSSAW